MNGYHSGLLRVYVREGDGPRVVRWQMYGDQQPGWKSADIELIVSPITEVHSLILYPLIHELAASRHVG